MQPCLHLTKHMKRVLCTVLCCSSNAFSVAMPAAIPPVPPGYTRWPAEHADKPADGGVCASNIPWTILCTTGHLLFYYCANGIPRIVQPLCTQPYMKPVGGSGLERSALPDLGLGSFEFMYSSLSRACASRCFTLLCAVSRSSKRLAAVATAAAAVAGGGGSVSNSS